jgi:prophage DNA circulation protein
MNTGADEGTEFALQTLMALQSSVTGSGMQQAQLNYLCGVCAAAANANLDVEPDELADSAFWAQFTACFEQARLAGATYESMDVVRALVMAFVPTTWVGVAVTNFAVRLALSEQAQILAAITFTSRQQIDNYLNLIDANFSIAIDNAADNGDVGVYQALIALEAAVVYNLSTEAAPLPQIVQINLARSMPALTIAQRLYQDPTQAGALIAMNSVANPVFMPPSLTVLSLG